ncbi:DUF5412 family protein [Pseudomonadota bacterium]
MKALKVIGITLGVVVLALLGAGYYLFSNICENTVVASSESPDGKWKVILFERNCGATTGFSSQISLIPSNGKLTNKPGNVYIAEGYPEEYTITWETDTSVRINGVKGKNYKQEDKVDDIHFSYE